MAAAGAVMAFGIGQAEAVPTTVAGVIVDTDTTFVFSNMTENFVDQPGEELFGFGKVTQINNLTGTDVLRRRPLRTDLRLQRLHRDLDQHGRC